MNPNAIMAAIVIFLACLLLFGIIMLVSSDVEPDDELHSFHEDV